MIQAKKAQQAIWNAIAKYGSDGEAIRVVSRPIVGTNSSNHNSYDEDGNEYFLLPTETVTADLERIQFKYVAKQLRGREKSPISLDSSEIRFSCISQDLFKADFLKNKIVKGDMFKTFDGVEYSIDRVNHVGQMQNVEILLELECTRV